jgi:hypothetical protein
LIFDRVEERFARVARLRAYRLKDGEQKGETAEANAVQYHGEGWLSGLNP